MKHAVSLVSAIVLSLALCAHTPQHTEAQPQQVSEEMSLSVGENRTISAADVKSYSEGAPGIVDVKVTPGGGQFVVVAQKPGSTTLLLIKRDGQEVLWKINVFPQPVQVVEAELAQLLDETTGIRIRRVGSRFFIEGGVTDEGELKRIEQIAGLYPGQVVSLVVLGGVSAERKINIRMDLYFVQYNKTRNLQAGISWPGTIGGAAIESTFAYDFLAKTTLQAVAGISDHPMPGLDIAARNGWAKILKHATVVTGNGAEAEFANGGAQWFPANNGLTSTLREIPFGITLKVLPRFDPKTKEMQVKVGADVAELTPPITGATDLPGQNTSKLSTSVAMKLGQSLVLSGVRMNTTRRTKSGIPYLSQIPILGALFGSTGKLDDDTEGGVIVVPSVIESVPRRAADLVDRALGEFDGYDGDMREVTPFETSPALRPDAAGAR